MLQYIASLGFVFLNVHSAHQNSPDDEARALKSLIYHLYVDASSKVEEMPESVATMEAVLKSDFRPKDFWNDKEYSFGYGKSPSGDILIFAWKNDRNIPDLSLEEIKERYLDDRFAKIQDSKNLESWKLSRKDIAGSFIGLRRGELNVDTPMAAQKISGPLEKTLISSFPMVFVISTVDSKKVRKVKEQASLVEKDKIN